MGWQSASVKVEIKARIRRRDGYRCVACGLDRATHKKRYGTDLEVHRVVPRSNYSLEWGDCVTLCGLCHDALHGKGTWGWITREDFDDDEQLARRVRRSTDDDIREERQWRRRADWGAWVRELRTSLLQVSELRLGLSVGVPERTVRDWEAGRCEPVLSQAKRLATALRISLDELTWDDDPGDDWVKACEERSNARAAALRARDLREDETLGRGAALVRDIVARTDDKRAAEREAARERHSAWFREQHANRPVLFRCPTRPC